MSSTIYKPYLAAVRETAPVNPVKAFLRELDRLAPTKIPHNVAFRTYRSQKQFAEIWEATIHPAEPELELAVRLLSNHHSLVAAESLIRAWWTKHNIQSDEIGLIRILAEAAELTADKRLQFQIRKEEDQAAMRVTKTGTHIRALLVNGPGTPAEIAEALEMTRKAVGKQLERMHAKGEVSRTPEGTYYIGNPPQAVQTPAVPVPVEIPKVEKVADDHDVLFARSKQMQMNISREEFDRMIDNPDFNVRSRLEAVA